MSKDRFNEQFLGMGKSFPVREDNDTGSFANSRGDALVDESFAMFMSTRRGGRTLLERYGLPAVCFENNDASVIALIRDALFNDFPVYENRVIILHVETRPATSQSGLEGVSVTARYKLKATGAVNEMDHFIPQERR